MPRKKQQPATGPQRHLPPNQLNTVIRFIKKAPLDRVAVLRQATFDSLRRLGVKRNVGKAVAGVPAGSDQGDVQSLIVWMGRITAADREAVAQLVAIDATAVQRSA